MSDSLNNLGAIWYQSEPSDIPYSPNQFLGWDFFCRFLQQDGSKIILSSIYLSMNDVAVKKMWGIEFEEAYCLQQFDNHLFAQIQS